MKLDRLTPYIMRAVQAGIVPEDVTANLMTTLTFPLGAPSFETVVALGSVNNVNENHGRCHREHCSEVSE